MGQPGGAGQPGWKPLDQKTADKFMDWANKKDPPKPLAGAGQPGWKPLDPDVTDKVFDWADKNENLLDVLVPYVRTHTNQFLDEWMTQMVNASGVASKPAKESESHWFAALAGNLLWAAACFVPGAGVIDRVGQGMTSLGKTMYVAMTGVGAAFGGGLADHMPSPAVDSDGEPTGKDDVGRALAKQRKTLGVVFEKMINPWCAQLMLQSGFHFADFRSDRNAYLEAVDHLIWKQLFPEFAFQDFEEMFNEGITTINGALADFNRQYAWWRDQQQAFILGVVIQPDNRYPGYQKNGYYQEYANRSGLEKKLNPMAYFLRHHPFRPKLNFK